MAKSEYFIDLFRGISLIGCMIQREPCDNQRDTQRNYGNFYVLGRQRSGRPGLDWEDSRKCQLPLDQMKLKTYPMREEESEQFQQFEKDFHVPIKETVILRGRNFLYFLGSQGLGVKLQAKGKDRIQDIKSPCHMGKPNVSGFVLSMEKRKRWRRKHVSWLPSRLKSQRVCVQW